MKPELVPRAELAEIETQSERAVARALLDTLQAPWVIIHSLPWLKLEGFLTEGEADFVLIHPEFGLLVLEVKGGRLAYDSNTGVWLQNGKPMKRSPLEQARSSMHQLVKTIKQRSPHLSFTFGYAAVFPDYAFTGFAPPGGENCVIAGYPQMKRLGPFLQDALTSWGKKPKLSQAHFGELRRGLLSDFNLVLALQKDVERNEQLMIRLTEQQMSVLRGLDKNPRVHVEGAAGTGKTLLAVRRAELFAQQGLRTLFLCYNRNLMAEVAHRLQDQPIKVATFHSLCRDACDKAGVTFVVPDGQTQQQFWNEEAPERLLNALDELPEYRFDAVIVDEAQDFEGEWWDAVERLLAQKDRFLYIFFDRRQNLYCRPVSLPSCAARFDLTTNCRNTRRIAESCGRIIDFEVELSPFAPEGTLTQIVRYTDRKDAAKRAQVALDFFQMKLNIPRSRIACLSPFSPEKCSLKGLAAMTSDLGEWRGGQSIWVSSIKAFKGLEADALVITDLGDFKPGVFDRADFYVACSRARQVLVILTESDEVEACCKPS